MSIALSSRLAFCQWTLERIDARLYQFEVEAKGEQGFEKIALIFFTQVVLDIHKDFKENTYCWFNKPEGDDNNKEYFLDVGFPSVLWEEYQEGELYRALNEIRVQISSLE